MKGGLLRRGMIDVLEQTFEERCLERSGNILGGRKLRFSKTLGRSIKTVDYDTYSDFDPPICSFHVASLQGETHFLLLQFCSHNRRSMLIQK